MSEVITLFEAAADRLVEDGPIKQRLIRAYSDHLAGVTEIKLPQEAADLFRTFTAALHAVQPVGRESPVQASVQKMSAAEAAAHARTILRLYRLLLVAGKRVDHLKVIESAPAVNEAPPFLVGAT